ncbi:MAG: hypothetical protein JW726_08500 [Anaerolineales bacterium]|nr:hypothetical protein [Anaerolineales bacterium]
MGSRVSLILLSILGALTLASCGSVSAPSPTATLGLTQVYQTVEAMLTQAYTPPPPSPTITPTVGRSPTARTLTPPPTQATSLTPSTIPQSQDCNRAAAGIPIDLTIPDDTEMQPGESFTKIWKLQNVGTCTWTVDYSASFFYGEQMGAPNTVALSTDVPPGESVEITVEMIAPQKPGTYQGNWKLSDAAGGLFGIGPNSDAPFWVRIIVIETASRTPQPSPTPTATRTPTPTTMPSPTPTTIAQAAGSMDLASGDTLDLDTAISNPEQGADLAFQRDSFYWLMPQSGAILGVWGSSQPELNACQSARMSSAPLAIESLTTGIYLCYLTDQGIPGWLRVGEWTSSSGLLQLEFFTWAVP